jgi:hypothetical protein
MIITIDQPVRRFELMEHTHYYFVNISHVHIKESTVRDVPEKIKEKAN